MHQPRATPLAVCPDLICRRSGLCHNTALGEPCRKFFMSDDEWRDELSTLLENLYIEWTGDPDALKKPRPEPSEEALAELQAALLEREAELDAEAAAQANALPPQRRSRYPGSHGRNRQVT